MTDVANLNAALQPAPAASRRCQPSTDAFVAVTDTAAPASSATGATTSAGARSSGAVASILNAFLGDSVDDSTGSPYQSSGSRTTGSSSAVAEGPHEGGDDDAVETKWACARCTFLNHPALPDCELCSTRRTLCPFSQPQVINILPNQIQSASAASIAPNTTPT